MRVLFRGFVVETQDFACGTTTLVNLLSVELGNLGVEVFNIHFEKEEWHNKNSVSQTGHLYENLDFGNRVKHLVVRGNDTKHLAHLALDFIREQEIEILIPMNCPILTSIIPHLPNTTRVLICCNNNNKHSYHFATHNLDRVNRIITMSPRQIKDLSKEWGVSNKKTVLIPNGIEVMELFGTKNFEGKLQICYLGRLEDKHKGVKLLPEIIEGLQVADVPFEFYIIGDGPDQKYLQKKLQKFSFVHFRSGLSRKEVFSYLEQMQVLIMPSRMEGFGLVSIEAMSKGVVPIVNQIVDVLDWIVEDSKDGFVVKSNCAREYVDRVLKLHTNRELLRDMSGQAQRKVREKFNSKQMVISYMKVFEESLLINDTDKNPVDFRLWKEFKPWKPNVRERVMLQMEELLSVIKSSKFRIFSEF